MTFTQINAATFQTPLLGRLVTPLARGLQAGARRWRIARTIQVLETLDDHLLKDVGVNRSEIRDLATRMETPRFSYANGRKG